MPQRFERVLLAAGFVPLPWFLLWTALGGALAPHYSALSQHASELTLLPGIPHTLLSVAALGSGAAFFLFAVGLWLDARRGFALGAFLWMLFGISMGSNGIWRMGSPKHGLYAIGLACIIAPALSLLEMPRLRDERIAFGITAFASIAAVFYLWMNMTGNDPQNLRGLTQRVFSSINSLWPATIAYLLLREQKYGNGTAAAQITGAN